MTTRTYLRWTLDGKPMQARASAIIKPIGVTEDDGTRGTFFVLDMACVYYPFPVEEAKKHIKDAIADPNDGDQNWRGSRSDQTLVKAAERDPSNVILEF